MLFADVWKLTEGRCNGFISSMQQTARLKLVSSAACRHTGINTCRSASARHLRSAFFTLYKCVLHILVFSFQFISITIHYFDAAKSLIPKLEKKKTKKKEKNAFFYQFLGCFSGSYIKLRKVFGKKNSGEGGRDEKMKR